MRRPWSSTFGFLFGGRTGRRASSRPLSHLAGAARFLHKFGFNLETEGFFETRRIVNPFSYDIEMTSDRKRNFHWNQRVSARDC